MLLLVLLLGLSGFHTCLVVQEVVHLCVLLIHHVLGGIMLVITHLVLHYRLVLELLQTKVLLISRSHIGALHELLTLSPSRILFHWDLASLGLRRKVLLPLPKLLLLALALAKLSCLRIVFKSISNKLRD